VTPTFDPISTAPQLVFLGPFWNIVRLVVLKTEVPRFDCVVKVLLIGSTLMTVPSLCINGSGAALAIVAKPITIAVAQNVLRMKTSRSILWFSYERLSPPRSPSAQASAIVKHNESRQRFRWHFVALQTTIAASKPASA
jgi:hypothetical protein